jgi:hypothetical protein
VLGESHGLLVQANLRPTSVAAGAGGSRRIRVPRSGRGLAAGCGAGGVGRGRAWTAEELPLLGTISDEELAQQLRRSVKSVVVQRLRQGKATCEKRVWTPEEDEIVQTYLPPVAAQKTGRTLNAVYLRRTVMGLQLGKSPFETRL